MSWLFSQALVAEYSGATSSDGEPCAQLSVMPTAHPFWRNDKTMDCSRFSRFGLTSQVLTEDHGGGLLTWFREDFLAKTSVPPATGTDSTEPEADSGGKWRGSFVRYDPDTSTWRTHQSSLLEGFTEFSETWPNSGSMRNGECWERPTLELRTSESESGYLPTPVTLDTGSRFNRSPSSGAALRPTLGAMAATFFLGDDELVIPMPFRNAQRLADVLERRYQEGYRAGLATARQQIQLLERYA